jgi:hypothetical protein
MKRLLLTLLPALLAVSVAGATTYVRVEKDGSKTYSDRPIPGGQPVEIAPAQTYSAPPPASNANPSASPETQLVQEMGSFSYESCELSPKKEEQFSNPQSIAISVAMKPMLRPGDVVKLTVDGQVVSSSGGVNYSMSPAFRGTHTASVQVSDRYGRTLCSADTLFHVFQPNLNSPARRPPPPPPKK